ncbi:MAG: hypothetical protein ABSD96_05095 [Candidatus Korobacteraceae bacterium]
MTVRRLKRYASDTGRVYEYYFVEKRPALTFCGTGVEYVYDVSCDRQRSVFAVSVLVLDEAAADWAARHGRALDDRERYAAAKLELHRAFDEIEDLHQFHRQLQVGPEKLEELLAPLDL